MSRRVEILAAGEAAVLHPELGTKVVEIIKPPPSEGGEGTQGPAGDSAYDVAVNNGFVGTESEWLASLKGEPGDPGDAGSDGKSAYQIAVDNGFVGTESEWLTSLEGAPGDPGDAGADGKSAYQIAVDNGFVGTEAEWLISLKGEKGDQGEAGSDGVVDYSKVSQEVLWDKVNRTWGAVDPQFTVHNFRVGDDSTFDPDTESPVGMGEFDHLFLPTSTLP